MEPSNPGLLAVIMGCVVIVFSGKIASNARANLSKLFGPAIAGGAGRARGWVIATGVIFVLLGITMMRAAG